MLWSCNCSTEDLSNRNFVVWTESTNKIIDYQSFVERFSWPGDKAEHHIIEIHGISHCLQSIFLLRKRHHDCGSTDLCGSGKELGSQMLSQTKRAGSMTPTTFSVTWIPYPNTPSQWLQSMLIGKGLWRRPEHLGIS
jgi:hypothetical protein